MKRKQKKDKQVYIFKIVVDVIEEGTISRRQYILDDRGNKKVFWAYYKAISGREIIKEGAVKPDCVAEFIVNWQPDLTSDYYIFDIVAKKIYEIKYINDLEGYKDDLTVLVSLASGVVGDE